MFYYDQQLNHQDSEHQFAMCQDLMTVAAELEIETPFAIGLEATMSIEQLQTVRGMLEQAIEEAGKAAREKLRKLRRCPQGYKWQEDGSGGWYCEGGTHFADAEEIKKFLD